MAYLLTHFVGGTEDRYNDNCGGAPSGRSAGQNYHAAGPTDGGILIAAVWESRNNPTASSKTSCCQVCPSRGGLAGPPEERAAEIVSDGVHQ